MVLLILLPVLALDDSCMAPERPVQRQPMRLAPDCLIDERLGIWDDVVCQCYRGAGYLLMLSLCALFGASLTARAHVRASLGFFGIDEPHNDRIAQP